MLDFICFTLVDERTPKGPPRPQAATSRPSPHSRNWRPIRRSRRCWTSSRCRASARRTGGWTPELQREFIARLAITGRRAGRASDMGKDLTGMMKVYRSPLAASFRASWHGAIELASAAGRERPRRCRATRRGQGADHRPPAQGQAPGFRRRPVPGPGAQRIWRVRGRGFARPRAEEARDSIARKLLNARRLYLQEISGSAGKRAAFEILTELPIDWEKAQKRRAAGR